MEEKKIKAQDTPVEKKKLTYDELNNVAHQLSEQAKTLYSKLQEANMVNMFKRLDYLFKVVENAHTFSDAFVSKCISEIEELITIPEDEKDDEDSNEESK